MVDGFLNMENTFSLYIDTPIWVDPINVDDFIITIGQKKSNSVYHDAETRRKKFVEKRFARNYVKVYRSDLITALKREQGQKLIPIQWKKRNNKSK